MKKIFLVMSLVASSCFADSSIAEKIDLSNLMSASLSGIKMYSVNSNTTIKFDGSSIVETSTVDKNVCSGKYRLTKKLLDGKAWPGHIFIVIGDYKCVKKEEVNLISYYLEVPAVVTLGKEIPVVTGGLIQETEGHVEKTPLLEFTGDLDGVTFSR